MTFLHQFRIKFTNKTDQASRMWAKKFSTNITWTLEEGIKLLLDIIPEKEMWATDILPLFKKGARMQHSLDWIQNELLLLEKSIFFKTKAFFSPKQIEWWKTFFEE
jgi:hypothetical protein